MHRWPWVLQLLREAKERQRRGEGCWVWKDGRMENEWRKWDLCPVVLWPYVSHRKCFNKTRSLLCLLGTKIILQSGGSTPTCWVIPLSWEPLLPRNVGVQPWLWENWFHGGSRRIWMGNWRDLGLRWQETPKNHCFFLPKMAQNHLKFLNLKSYCKEADTPKSPKGSSSIVLPNQRYSLQDWM